MAVPRGLTATVIVPGVTGCGKREYAQLIASVIIGIGTGKVIVHGHVVAIGPYETGGLVITTIDSGGP